MNKNVIRKLRERIIRNVREVDKLGAEAVRGVKAVP